MAVSIKDIETLWKRYQEDGCKRGISVAKFFESNGVPYHTFEKWYIWSSFARSGFNARIIIWNGGSIKSR